MKHRLSTLALGAILASLGMTLAILLLSPALRRVLGSSQEVVFGEIHANLADHYIEPIDEDELLRRAVRGMVHGLDPYSVFYGPEELRVLEEESTGQLVGIGVLLTPVSEAAPHPLIRFPLPGGPAETGGVQPGDRLLRVNGESLEGKTMDEIVGLVKGPRGTAVRLGLDRKGGAPFDLELTRAPVLSASVHHPHILDSETGIATLWLSSFTHSSPDEIDAALDLLADEGMRGLILDMRFNPGGMFDAAVEIAGRFLSEQTVATLDYRNMPDQAFTPDPVLCRWPELPVVILLERKSASGAELLAAALRERGGAAVVGERSFGKGAFQSVWKFPEHGFAFKFASGYYLTPDGNNLEGHINGTKSGGIVPDILIENGEEQRADIYLWLNRVETPEKYRAAVEALWPDEEDVAPHDPQLDAAIALLRKRLAEDR